MRKFFSSIVASAVGIVASGALAAPITYTDTHGDGVGSTNAARDIWSLTLNNDATNLLVTIDLNTAANTGANVAGAITNNFDYALGMTTGPAAGGDTSANATTHGNPYHEDISIDGSLGGMTAWLGIFPLLNGSGSIPGFNTYTWSTATSTWTKTHDVNTATLATAAGDAFASQPTTSTNNEIKVVVPLADYGALMTPGSTLQFDLYSTGATPPNTAYDSLLDASPTQGGTFSNTAQFNSTALASYTIQSVAPEPTTLALAGVVAGTLLRRNRR